MDIKELKRKREVLEIAIGILINDFMKESGVNVKEIISKPLSFTAIGEGDVRYKHVVKVEIEL